MRSEASDFLASLFGPALGTIPRAKTSGAVVATDEPETLRGDAEAERETIQWCEKLYRGDAKQDLAAAAAPRPRSAVPVPVEWPGAAADFCLLLTVDDLPATPFALNGWTTVTGAAKFLRSLRGDIAAGPSGPRAFYGALQADLLELQQFVLQAAEIGDRPKGEEKPEATT